MRKVMVRKLLWRNERGFTLIELLATLGILALILAIAVPAVAGILDKAEAGVERASVELVERAGEIAHLSELPFDADAPVLDSYYIETLTSAGFLNMDFDSMDGISPRDVVTKVAASGAFVFSRQDDAAPGAPAVEFPSEPQDVVVVDRTPTSEPVVFGDYTVEFYDHDTKARILEYAGRDTDLVIPGSFGGKPTTAIGRFGDIPDDMYGYSVFAMLGLSSVVIPETVQDIAGGAFMGNELTSLDLPASLVWIGEMAFTGSSSTSLLTGELVLPEGLRFIGEFAFAHQGFDSVVIPDRVTHIGDYAFFYNESLQSVKIGDGVEIIGAAAFLYTPLSTLILGKNVREIKEGAFLETDISAVVFPEGIERIGPYAFSDTNITEVILPVSLIEVGSSAFWGILSELAMVEVHNPDMLIGDYAFAAGVYPATFLVRGHSGSTIEVYAEYYGVRFERMDI